jgi:antitoxin component YwqK of YwqJK toxin-antitoxin module
MVGPAARVVACGVVVAVVSGWAPAAWAQQFRIVASCRDGYPHGAYELRSAGGQLRVAGAFNRGKRTSSFLFWTSNGVRVAHIPFDEDQKSGTLSLWYADARPGREPQQKLEAVFSAGRRNGTTRSWHANGKARTILRYEHGELVEAQAWNASGVPLSESAARDLATRDREDDERYYASLDAIVMSHLPRCDSSSPSQQRASADGVGHFR